MATKYHTFTLFPHLPSAGYPVAREISDWRRKLFGWKSPPPVFTGVTLASCGNFLYGEFSQGNRTARLGSWSELVTKDHYDILGISPSADDEVIAAAYRALAKKYHPDTGTHGGTASTERFREIQDAYQVLGNARARADYDKERHEARAKGAASSASGKSQKTKSGSERTSEPESAAPTPTYWRNGGPKLMSRLALVAALASLAVGSAYLLGMQGETPSIAWNSEQISGKSNLASQSGYIAPDLTGRKDVSRIVGEEELIEMENSGKGNLPVPPKAPDVIVVPPPMPYD